MNTKSKLMAIALGVACSMPAVSMAESINDQNYNKSVKVNFADLDLSSSPEVAALYSRLKSAAKQSCGNRNVKQARLVMERKSCVKAAMNDAIAKVDNVELASMHNGGSYTQQYSQSDD